jgi:hypothetical protein
MGRPLCYVSRGVDGEGLATKGQYIRLVFGLPQAVQELQALCFGRLDRL